MAEGILKKLLTELGRKDVLVGSAGIAAVTGVPPTDETVQAAQEAGIDVSGYHATDLTDWLIEDADIILVMENVHKEEIVRRVPRAASKTFLLKEYAYPEKIQDPEMYGIQDPIGWGADYYRHTFGVIKREIERIVPTL
jgi:protein-tyrosine phosphatase